MYMCDVQIGPRCTKIEMPQESVDFLNDGTALIFAKAQFQKDTQSSGNGPSESLQGWKGWWSAIYICIERATLL